MKCAICEDEVSKIHRHHLNYKKDLVIKVCVPCHGKIHSSSNKYKHLKPVDKRPNQYLGSQINVVMSKELSAWLNKEDLSPTAIFNKACEELGFEE